MADAKMALGARKKAALMGALVADAACLGSHWIYDVGRLADLRDQYGSLAFLKVDPTHYEGGVGYFAHGARRTGMSTQYGAVLALALSTIRRQGGFDEAAYQADFAAFFGAGGAWQGYIDRPTRGALANIAAKAMPTGIDDDQLPAMATLPGVIAAHYGAADLREKVAQAVSVTNVNAVALSYAMIYTDLLSSVIRGMPLRAALEALEAPELRAALASDEADSTVYAKDVTGQACHLPMAMPLAVHILARATSFEEAAERNINAGGDSAGRAIIIGALAGAEYGLAGQKGVPLPWLLRLDNGAALYDTCCSIG